MSETYEEYNRKHRRLSILLVLSGADAYRSNDSMLYDVVNEFGIASTRDQVRGELTWLAQQGFITVREIATAMVATLTEQGSDIAAGRARHPNIARPKAKG
jgi:hypothetical protein